MAIVNSILAMLAEPEGPGRLSAEFSADVKPSGVKFEFGPGELASWLKPTATTVAMKFEDRRRPITALIKHQNCRSSISRQAWQGQRRHLGFMFARTPWKSLGKHCTVWPANFCPVH